MLPVSDEADLGEEGVAGHHHHQAGQAEHPHRHRQAGEGGAEVDGAGGQDLRGFVFAPSRHTVVQSFKQTFMSISQSLPLAILGPYPSSRAFISFI